MPSIPKSTPSAPKPLSMNLDKGFAAGLVGGVARDPIVQLGLSTVFERDQIKRIQQLGGNGYGGQIGRAVGEFGTLLVPGFQAFKGGQIAGRAGLKAAAEAFGTTKGVTGTMKAKNLAGVPLRGLLVDAKSVGPKADALRALQMNAGMVARSQERLGVSNLLHQAARKIPAGMSPSVALRKGFIEKAELETLKRVGIPTTKTFAAGDMFNSIPRVFEVAGGNLGIGTLTLGQESARAIYDGDDFEDAARHAALVTVLGLGFEGGLTALTRIPGIRADFGLLRTLSLEYQHKLGIVDSAGAPLRVGNMIEGTNAAAKAASHVIKNPLFQRPTPNSAQFARGIRQANKDLKAAGITTQAKELRQATIDTLSQLNRILGNPTTGLLDPSKPRLMPGELTLLQARKIKDIGEFQKVANVQWDLAVPKAEESIRKSVSFKLRDLQSLARQADNFEALLKHNPLVAYTDRGPAITTDMEFLAYKWAIQAFITPEGFAPTLGPGFEKAMQEIFIPIGMANTKAKDAAKRVMGAFKKDVNKIVGLTNRDASKLGNRPEGMGITNIYVKMQSLFESNGRNKARVVQDFMRDIKHQGKGNRNLTQQEAEKLYDVWESIRRTLDEGVTEPLVLQGIGATSYPLRGFKTLRDIAPDQFDEISPSTIGAQLGSPDAVFMPHHLLPFPNDQFLVDKLSTMLGMDEAMRIIGKGSMARQRDSRPLFGSLDFHRNMPGTLEEKILKGVPLMDDPFEAGANYLYGVNNVYESGIRLGFHKGEQEQVLKAIQRLIAVENATPSTGARQGAQVAQLLGNVPKAKPQAALNTNAAVLASNIMDIALGTPWEEEALRKWASVATAFNVVTKLPMAVFANMTQTTQTATMMGTNNVFRGFRNALKKEERDVILRGVANIEGILLDQHTHSFADRGFRSPGLGSVIANTIQRAADFTLSKTGFRSVEAFNRIIGGGAAMNRAFEIVAKGAGMGPKGVLLKGKQLEVARRHAKAMGFDLDDVIQKVRKGGTMDVDGKEAFKWFNTDEGINWLQRTIFQGAQQTQFIVTPSRKPLYWNTPNGRVIFQFKTFAMHQYRFLRDQVVGELGRGNAKPLATFMGIAPIAGEFAGSMKEIIKDGRLERGQSGMARYLQNIMYVGGGGILTDMIQAARFEQFAESALGPTAGDFIGWIEQFSRNDANGFFRDLSRLPVMRVTRALHKGIRASGSLAVDYFDELSDAIGDREEGPTGKVISPGELIQRTRQR